MIRLIIIGEGQTEQAFCKDVLQPYFATQSIYIQNPTIKKSKGGIVAWEVFKKEILNHLKSDTSAYVSLLIDYYGIKAKHEFPKWDEAQTIVDENERMDFLENAMLEDFKEKYQVRLIPYIQLHEFEGLLFCEQDVFDDNFEDEEFLDYNYLYETIDRNPNPEMINKGSTTAPSKRLMKILEGYQKTVHGPLIAQEIGLRKMRQKCPRFNNWIEKLSKL